MAAETQNPSPDPRDNKLYYYDITPFRSAVVPILELIFRAFTIIQSNGTENLFKQGPIILIANHISVYDMFPMQFVLSRPIFFMAKAEIHQNAMLDAMLRQLGSFPIERGTRDKWALDHAKKVLEHGQVLGMFPEGTRSKKGLRTGKTGAARLAISENCPIAPMALEGTQTMFSGFPRRSHVNITLGEPIYPEPRDTALDLTDRIMFALADMLPTDLRGVYAERPPGF